MSNAGIFFLLSALELSSLRELPSSVDRREWIDDLYSKRVTSPSLMVDVDVAWDAMHRCLGDGSLDESSTQYPLRIVVLGGEAIGNDAGLIMRLKTPKEVQRAADGLARIDVNAFRSCYFSIPSESYLIEPNEHDFQFTWTYFQQVQEFYFNAAKTGHSVLFIAYQ